MESLEHEVWLAADTEHVFEALTTVEGLDSWWGRVVSAEPRIGFVVEFDHELGEPLRMEITDLVPNERLAWKCISDFSDATNPASEWRNQTFVFELSPRGPIYLLGVMQHVSVLRFRNAGWRPGARWHGFCNTGWGEALGVRLKNALQDASDG
jgi:hypothetical protein